LSNWISDTAYAAELRSFSRSRQQSHAGSGGHGQPDANTAVNKHARTGDASGLVGEEKATIAPMRHSIFNKHLIFEMRWAALARLGKHSSRSL
jgi:hypothetical protein